MREMPVVKRLNKRGITFVWVPKQKFHPGGLRITVRDETRVGSGK